MSIHGGFSAYQMVFGSNSAGLYSRQDNDSGLEYVRNTWITWQFTPRWMMRVMPLEAMSKEVANE